MKLRKVIAILMMMTDVRIAENQKVRLISETRSQTVLNVVLQHCFLKMKKFAVLHALESREWEIPDRAR